MKTEAPTEQQAELEAARIASFASQARAAVERMAREHGLDDRTMAYIDVHGIAPEAWDLLPGEAQAGAETGLAWKRTGDGRITSSFFREPRHD